MTLDTCTQPLAKHTSHTQVLGGVPCTLPNRTDEVETGSPHWYISYNTHDRATYGCDTTALVLGQMEYFLVLNGDHRQALADVIADKTVARSRLCRCLDYVRAHADQLNKYSNRLV